MANPQVVVSPHPTYSLFEIDGMGKEEADEAFRLCSYKLPIRTKAVGRRDIGV